MDNLTDEQKKELAQIEVQRNNTFELKDVEIFASGKWNGDQYSNEDIDNMVANFRIFGSKLKVPMKLGHDPDQKFKKGFPQKDGMPALGWVKELKRDGKKLLATFAGVPLKIKDLINKGAYGRFSSEIMWNMQYLGNTFKKVLSAVSLLGADTPAVRTIDDIVGLYTLDEIEPLAGDLHAYHKLEHNEREEIEIMELKELEQKNQEQEAQIKTLSEAQGVANAEKEKALAETQELKQKLFDKEQLEKNAKAYSAIDQAIKEFKVLPAHREVLASLLVGEVKDGKLSHTYTANEKEETMTFGSTLDVLVKVFSEMPAIHNNSEQSSKGQDQEKPADEKVAADDGKVYKTDAMLNEKIEKIQAEKKLTYSEAYDIAIMEVN